MKNKNLCTLYKLPVGVSPAIQGWYVKIATRVVESRSVLWWCNRQVSTTKITCRSEDMAATAAEEVMTMQFREWMDTPNNLGSTKDNPISHPGCPSHKHAAESLRVLCLVDELVHLPSDLPNWLSNVARHPLTLNASPYS